MAGRRYRSHRVRPEALARDARNAKGPTRPSTGNVSRRDSQGWPMTSWRQFEPIPDGVSELGAAPQVRTRRSRRRAWRDGFASQTVIENIEDRRSYRSFEHAIVASFSPRSVIELELIHRLACLLWRLRRASAIETGLFQQANLQRGYRSGYFSLRARTRQGKFLSNLTARNQPHSIVAHEPGYRIRARWRNASCGFLILMRHYLSEWALMKPRSGGKRHRRFGFLMQ